MPAFTNPEAYNQWMGRWSARLAPHFVHFADLGRGGRFLDVGAGTGVLAEAVLDASPSAEVVGIEPSASYVHYAREHLHDPRLRFEQGDAMSLPFADDSFDGALALLILQEVPDGARVAAEMRRVTRPGGTVAACQWDFVGGMPMLSLFWDSVRAVLPGAETEGQAARRVQPGYSDTGALEQLWTDAGLAELATTELQIAMEFETFDDYWLPFLGGATPTSSYAATLAEDARQQVAARLREKLIGAGPDRPFELPARAWAVKGHRPP